MCLRAIRQDERLLIEHMLRQVDDGNRFRIPAEVEDFIALTINQHDELYDLDFWKADFTPLQRFPAPHQVQLCE